MTTLNWYALQVRGGREQSVRRAIEETFVTEGVSEALGEIVIPSYEKITSKEGKIKKKKTYFGYMLVEFDATNKKALNILRYQVDGIYRFLGVDGNNEEFTPLPIPQEEVIAMVEKASTSPETLGTDETIFKENSYVKVLDGVFSNAVGRVRKYLLSKDKVLVSITMYGNEIESELDPDQLELIQKKE